MYPIHTSIAGGAQDKHEVRPSTRSLTRTATWFDGHDDWYRPYPHLHLCNGRKCRQVDMYQGSNAALSDWYYAGTRQGSPISRGCQAGFSFRPFPSRKCMHRMDSQEGEGAEGPGQFPIRKPPALFLVSVRLPGIIIGRVLREEGRKARYPSIHRRRETPVPSIRPRTTTSERRATMGQDMVSTLAVSLCTVNTARHSSTARDSHSIACRP